MMGRFVVTALCLLLATGCPGGGEEERDWTPMGGFIPGGLWGFALDAQGQPLVSTYSGIVRLEGSSWVDVPTDGLRRIGALTFDSTGALYTRSASETDPGNQGQLWRRPAGATTWERFDDGLGVQVLPVQATDGVLYMGAGDGGTGVYRFVYREPGATSWTPTGVTYDPVYDSLVADDEGNVWVFATGLAPTRINRTQSTPFPQACAAVRVQFGRPTLLAVVDGTLYCSADSYVERNGVIGAFDIATGRATALNDGSCRDGDPGECDEDFPAEAGFVTQTARSARGDFYSIWASNNGAYPYLLRLRRGETVWQQVTDLGVPWQAGNGGLGFRVRGETIHLFSSLYTGSFDPGDGSVDPGGFYGYVYRPF